MAMNYLANLEILIERKLHIKKNLRGTGQRIPAASL